MGLESLFRTARVKEGSQGTAVLDVEKQEIIEEARITDETDKAPNEYEHVTVASRTLESSLEEDLEKQRNGETDSNHAAASHIYTHDNHSLLRLLYEFLKVFESLLLHLKKFLKDDEGNVEICEAKYTCMVAQLKAQALMSTFTAALILAWCSLVKTLRVEGAHAELLYNVGLLVSLFAMVFHILNAILSSRCVSTYSEHKILKKKKKKTSQISTTLLKCAKDFIDTYCCYLLLR